MKPVFDATFYSGKPASDVLTFASEHVMPCLKGCTPIVITDRGAFGHNWRTSADTTSMDRAEFRAFADALPPGMTVCLDIEGEPKAVTEILVYALRSGRERRPDCVWGHYETHARYAAWEGADIPKLCQPPLTANERARARASQFIVQETYPRIPLPSPAQDLDKANGYRHIAWSAWACQRWRDFGRPVYAAVTGTCHVNPRVGVALSEQQVVWQAQVAARFDGMVLWDGAKWAGQDKYAGTQPFNPHGRWTGTAIAAFNAVREAA